MLDKCFRNLFDDKEENMLTLKNITKTYGEGENEVKALKGISISFRRCEFVSILGQSGCGKTTLLNIVGGLDQASSGELLLDGKSTSGFNGNDWDDYRNSKIGFVFQNYNLIPHLNVLTNVELALTISGVKSAERTERAKRALEMVGLGNKWNKRPNQLSGGQMQRVAIARAIVNEPEILLADEPTGAIDSDTSVQIMEILKEISKTRLVVMVTHNAELAEEYSTRVVRFLDGEIIDDTDPYEESEEIVVGETVENAEEESEKKTAPQKRVRKHKKGMTMSFFTAVKLSWKNLVNKKGRSVLTAIAGSIGIISIALILALNNGFTGYIADFERQSMSKYPITVSSGEDSVISAFEEFLGGDDLDGDSLNLDSVFDVLTGENIDREKFTEEEMVYIYGQFVGMFNAMQDSLTKTTDISKFKAHVENNFDYNLAKVKYDYSINMSVFNKEVEVDKDTQEEKVSYSVLNPLSESATVGALIKMMVGTSDDESRLDQLKTAVDAFAFWDEIVADEETINSQYDVLAGSLPKNMNEIVLVVDEYNQISDFDAFALNEMAVLDLIRAFDDPSRLSKFDQTFEEIFEKEYYVLPTSAGYVYNEMTGTFTCVSDVGGETLKNAIETNGIALKISGIIRPKEGINGGCINGIIGYTSALGNYIISDANESAITKKYQENYNSYMEATEIVANALKKSEEDPNYKMTPEESAASMKVAAKMKDLVTGKTLDITGYNNALKALNVRDLNQPSYIYFYPNRIADKQEIVNFITSFNEKQKAEEEEAARIAEENEEDESTVTYVIEYTDNLDSVVSELNSVVDTITYILVAVACVSVIVTMILIAIIMYISVQDRTREIGIMRAIGARKSDISNIFNVETMLLGLASGVIGVLIAYVLQFPGNLILKNVLNMAALLDMAWWNPIALIGGSIVITVISGLIPAAMAAKKEPVVALRTE